MEILLVVVVFVGIYLWSRLRAKRSEETRELRTFEHWHKVANDFTIVWRLDYVEMCLRTSALADHEMPDEMYHVRRTSASCWEMRLSDRSFAEQVRTLKESIANPASYWNPESDKETLKELGTSPQWAPIRDDLVGPIESQYQRFVQHWR